MRLIDADELLKDIRDWQVDIHDNIYDADEFDFVFERIYEILTEQLKGCIVENDKNFDDEQETLKGSYLQGQIDTIDKIYRYVKIECNPYGKPTIDFESGEKILNYLNRLKGEKECLMREKLLRK